MQFLITTAIFFALGSNIASCGPLIGRQSNPPSLNDISNAQNRWALDTRKVSQFLSSAESLSPGDLATQAAAALAASNDELTNKAVLDNVFVFVARPNAKVQQANNELADQGKFKFVVNGLRDLANNGANMSPGEVSGAIRSINADRCIFVLPSIDTYFQASGSVLNNGVTLTANRPNNC